MAYEQIGWATDDLDSDGNSTKIVPPTEIQATGLQSGQPMGRQWFNYMLNFLIKNTDPGAIAAADSPHIVRQFGAEQADLVSNGWVLLSQEENANASSGYIWTYEHVGV